MKGLFIGSSICTAVAYAALTWGPVAKAPIIPPHPPSSAAAVQHSSPAVSDPVLPVAEPSRLTPEPTPEAQQPPRIEMPSSPDLSRKGSTQAAEPVVPHRRPYRPADNQVGQVNRPVANGFTAELNRQEMHSLEAGGRAPPSAPWRELGAYR